MPTARDLTWRLVLDEPRPGAANMALDHAAAECLPPGQAVVRLYRWSRPTVSFGRNEPAAPVTPVAGAAAAAVDYVRRPTGGRAVLHDDELTYAVVAPLDAFGGLRQAYLAINRALADALASLGAEAEIAGEDAAVAGRALPPDAGPCFQNPAHGEIVSRGRKLVGSAQARLEGALLQHGSLLIGGDQRPLGAVPGELEPITLRELLGEVDAGDVAGAVTAAMRGRFGGVWVDGTWDERERDVADRLESSRYGNDAWTWRR